MTGQAARKALIIVLLALAVNAAAADEPIRLRAPQAAPAGETPPADRSRTSAEGRRGFDYDAFNGRLEALWFQRKAFLAAGREEDAANQSQLIRALCVEEGVRRLDGLAGVLLLEARRYLAEGNFPKALDSLAFADFFRPGDSRIRRARAEVLWKSGAGAAAAATEWLQAARVASVERWVDLSLAHRLSSILLLSFLSATTLFAALLALRHHTTLRHDVEEWLRGSRYESWGKPAGWAVLLLPLVLWIGAGWVALWWLVVTFRYQRRGERVAAVALLTATMLAVPAFHVVVALRGMTEDPMVRNTLESSGGAYDPERVVRLRKLVDLHPDDPTYHFLLGGLYQNGRYFEEAFDEYKKVFAVDPEAWQARINVGNIFFRQGQYAEAIVHYRKALDLRPRSVLAHYNAYVTQSDAFKFKEAQEYLDKGTAIDTEAMAELLYRTGRDGGRPMVVDATVDLSSLWRAALEGRPMRGIAERDGGESSWAPHLKGLFNPLSVAALLALIACPLSLRMGGALAPARRCIRCGRPFCAMCKSDREKGREYCTQCLHLFVLGDGLASETKTKKLYEVDRHARLARLGRRAGSLILPGAGLLLRGRALLGWLIVLIWVASVALVQPRLIAPIGWFWGLDLRLELLRAGPVPSVYVLDAAGAVGFTLALGVWLAANLALVRAREA